MTNVREGLGRVLSEYPIACKQQFKEPPLADFIRNDLPEALRTKVADPERYLFMGGPGLGQWAFAPWVAVLDLLITDTTQAGYYPVYLFREDFSGLYLSLNQGVTDVRRKFRSAAPDALHTQAINYRAQLGHGPTTFPDTEIDLRPSTKSRLSPDYEAGNVYARFYDARDLPSEEVISSDLRSILELYEKLRVSESLPIGTGATEDDEEDDPNLRIDEDLRKFRDHKRIERNQRLARKVKQIQGFTCKACGFDFSKVYMGIAKNRYIESHHLTPISELKGQRVSLDPANDFSVLCANCHRMIHRFEHPEDIEAFRKTLNTEWRDV